MCEKAGISGGYTNHSLRAYGATALFQAQVPEKLIQKRTGHRSLDTLRQYECTSAAQLLDLSNVMSGTSDPFSSVSLAPKKVNATRAVLPAVKEQTQNQVNSNQSIPLLPAGFQSTPMFIVNGCTFPAVPLLFLDNSLPINLVILRSLLKNNYVKKRLRM